MVAPAALEQIFTSFVTETEPKLRAALVAHFGTERGREATAEASAYGWENWERIRPMHNPAGYLYRVGQHTGFRKPRRAIFPDVPHYSDPVVEPALPKAMAQLSTHRRSAGALLRLDSGRGGRVPRSLGQHGPQPSRPRHATTASDPGRCDLMPDLERELARYGTVLRDRAPAVRIDEVESRLNRPTSGHRPVRAAVAGALLALAAIGVLFVGGALIDVLSTPSPTQEPSVSPASGAAPGPAVAAAVAGGGALAVLTGAAAVGLRHRHQNQQPQRLAKKRKRRKEEMRTFQKPVAPVERLERNNRYLIIGLVIAVLLAAGFGAWLLVDAIGSSTERQITSLLDEYGAAWEANDGEAVAALMTEDGAVLAGNGVTYQIDQLKGVVDNMGEFRTEPVHSLAIYETGTGWHVASPDQHGLELFNIVDRDGELLIRFHETWRGGK